MRKALYGQERVNVPAIEDTFLPMCERAMYMYIRTRLRGRRLASASLRALEDDTNDESCCSSSIGTCFKVEIER